MINLLGTNLELQEMMISDISFPIKLFLEALQVNSTLTRLFIMVPVMRDQSIVSLANMLQVKKTLTTVRIDAEGFFSAHTVQQLADSLMVNKTLNCLMFMGNAWGNDAVRILAGYMKRSESLSSSYVAFLSLYIARNARSCTLSNFRASEALQKCHTM